MSSYLLDPAWKSWYKAKHDSRYTRYSGEKFEEYITSVLRHEYDDFLNPSPMGKAATEAAMVLRTQVEFYSPVTGKELNLGKTKKQRIN